MSDLTGLYAAPIAWGVRPGQRRATCPCAYHRAIRCAERYPEHIRTLELDRKDAA